ncbi:unnamed protein product [Rhizoctonia solani]|uniref:Nephrocystin 3-like N-terminal domain-containing protein n=1 Tax=Rhizoctonia solani TaxID=456999 RepID=A0A8H3DQ42_9AGAM|nr:unnamed protein product [Rhizoctonia solani]
MPEFEWLKRQKHKLKRVWHAESRSSVSLPNPSNPSSSSSPVPQAIGDPVTEDDSNNALTPSALSLMQAPGPLLPIHPLGTASTSTVVPSPSLAAGGIETATNNPPTSSKSPTNDELKSHRQGRVKNVTWAGLKALLGILRSTSEAFSPLRAAFEGLDRCIKRFESAAEAKQELKELGEEVDQLLDVLSEFVNGLTGSAMTTSVQRACTAIEQAIEKLEEGSPEAHILPRKRPTAAGDPTNMDIRRKPESGAATGFRRAEEDLEKIYKTYKEIEQHIRRLMLDANLNLWKTMDEEVAARRLLQLSSAMSGAYNSGVSDSVKRGPCTKGTRIFELKKLRGWALSQSAKPIYWMCGMAGTGKTTISYSLCADLDATGELAASFFCTRLVSECRNVQLIIPAIAYQLAQFSGHFRHALSKVLAVDPVAHTRNLELQLQKLIIGPLKEMQNNLSSDFLIVIDALDECDDQESTGKILDLLIQTISELRVRFLVSSRPEPEIHRRMENQVGDKPDAKLVLDQLDPVVVKSDIEKYLLKELHDVPLTNEQRERLVERCGVLFIYASTACRYIKGGDEMMDYEEAVNTVLAPSSDSQGDAEKELDKLYLAILEKAFERSRINETNRNRMKMILNTVICAQERVTTGTLADLFKLKTTKQADALLRPLSSVVRVMEDTRIVTTLHASFTDFMLNSQRSVGFHCDPATHHNELTRTCLLRIQSNPVQFNLCNLESSYLLDNQVDDLTQRVERAIPFGLLYACRYWVAHLQLSAQLAEALEKPLDDFLSARLLLWMEVLNAGKCIGSGVNMIQIVESWCRRMNLSKNMIELANDAWQFVSVYANHSVSQSTAHIYASMLPFWPSNRPIAKYYTPRITGLLKPRGTALDGRQLPLLSTWHMGDKVQLVCYSPSGAQIVAAVGNDIYIVNAQTGEMALGPLMGHTNQVQSVAISPDALYIASGSCDSTIRVWDTQTGKAILTPLKGHHDRVLSIAFSPDSTRFVSTADETLRIWSIRDGNHVSGTFSKHTTRICTAVFSVDGSYIISGDVNGGIHLWDAHTGDPIADSGRLTGHVDEISSIALSSDGARFVCASKDSTISVWDTTTHRVTLEALKGHIGNVNQATFSPDGLYIASCGDGTIHLREAGSGETKLVLSDEHMQAVKSVAFSPDGSRLVSCSDDGNIRIWSMQHTDMAHAILALHTTVIKSATFSPDGSHLATGGIDGSICLWDTRNGELVLGPLRGHEGYIHSMDISLDGSYIASASSDRTIRLWDVKEGRGTHKILEGHTKRPASVKFLPGGLQLTYDSIVYTVGLSPALSNENLHMEKGLRDVWVEEISGHVMYPGRAAFSPSFPNGSRMVYFCSTARTQLVKNVEGKFLGIDLLGRQPNGISCIETSPDGLYIASGFGDGSLQVRNTRTGQVVMGPLHGHIDAISRLMFSPNDSRIVSNSCDYTIRFWPIHNPNQSNSVNHRLAGTNKEVRNTADQQVSWRLRPDGWVVDSQGNNLIWIPPDLRSYLRRPGNELLISNRGTKSFEMEFTGANIGKEWVRSYDPA